MKRSVSVFASVALLMSTPALADQDLEWAGGVGMMPCSRLASIDAPRLQDWTLGYWTGANLYLGGTDLCLERADLRTVGPERVLALLEVQCGGIPEDSPIMIAAFNALKGLPRVSGTRAAACQGD